MNQDIQALAEHIRGIRVAMLTTRQADGTLHSRPMATQETDFDGHLWFFTPLSCAKVREIQQDARVNLVYSDPDDNRFISVTGEAEMVQDPEKNQELWQPYYRSWFPKGLADPELGLLRVTVQRAEYWDAPSNAAVHLAGFAPERTAGERYQPPGTAGAPRH